MLFDAGAFVVFFNDTATTEIYTLSLHDALPILAFMTAGISGFSSRGARKIASTPCAIMEFTSATCFAADPAASVDRKSTRLNSSHANISYAVFCLKKKKKNAHPAQL